MKKKEAPVIGLALLIAVVVILFADSLSRRVGWIQASSSISGFIPDVDSTASDHQHAVDGTSAAFAPRNSTRPEGQRIRLASSTNPAVLHGSILKPHVPSLNQLQPALAGIRLAQEVVLNNIANAGTTGFKRSRVQFADLAYRQLALPGALNEQGRRPSSGLSVGLGMRVAGTVVDHSEGHLVQTGKSLDIAIVGDGFFQVQNGNRIDYTRAGTFSTNAEGEIVVIDSDRGRPLEPTITLPADTEDVVVLGDGSISVRQAGSQTMTQLGQIQTARFVNPQGLVPMGNNLFGLSDASGQPLIGSPGSDGLGELRSGFLEASNVVVESELFELRRLESHRRAIHYAMKLLAPGSPSMLDVDSPSEARTLLPPRIASEPRRESISRE